MTKVPSFSLSTKMSMSIDVPAFESPRICNRAFAECFRVVFLVAGILAPLTERWFSLTSTDLDLEAPNAVAAERRLAVRSSRLVLRRSLLDFLLDLVRSSDPNHRPTALSYDEYRGNFPQAGVTRYRSTRAFTEN